jgi:hypothetical protein
MDSATKQQKMADFGHLIAVETARKQIKNAVLITVFTGVAIPISWLVGTLVMSAAGYNGSRSGAGFYWILEVVFIFSKHPDRSVAWCNQQVIDRLTT